MPFGFGKKKEEPPEQMEFHAPRTENSGRYDWMGREIRKDGTIVGEPPKITAADRAPITQRGSVHCSLCDGVGTRYNGTMPCTRCEGTGIITAAMYARGIR